MHRVQKLLSNYGYCSRRKAEQLIEGGKVKVNGKVISLGDKAEETDKITVNGKPVKKVRKIYLMFNKPLKCVTALTDPKYKTIKDYIKLKERIFPIGRLDYNTSGLLLLTNDGDFANKVMHPRYQIKKTYLVRTNRPLTSSEQLEFKRGIDLEDGKTHPAKIQQLGPKLFQVTIHEGKNRIIRRMFKALNITVLTLERVQIGKLKLLDLPVGRYKPLTRKDMQRIFV